MQIQLCVIIASFLSCMARTISSDKRQIDPLNRNNLPESWRSMDQSLLRYGHAREELARLFRENDGNLSNSLQSELNDGRLHTTTPAPTIDLFGSDWNTAGEFHILAWEALTRLDDIIRLYQTYTGNRLSRSNAMIEQPLCSPANMASTRARMYEGLEHGYCGVGMDGTHLQQATRLNVSTVRQFQSHVSNMMCKVNNDSCIITCPTMPAELRALSISHDYHEVLWPTQTLLRCHILHGIRVPQTTTTQSVVEEDDKRSNNLLNQFYDSFWG